MTGTDAPSDARCANCSCGPDALATYRNIPRAFVLFLPHFALLLKPFYRRQGRD